MLLCGVVMKEPLKELCDQEIAHARLDFDSDSEYRAYYTQAEALWEGGDMPVPIFHLLETGSYLSFSHGFRLGLKLARQLRKG